jgi:Plavaka transposase
MPLLSTISKHIKFTCSNCQAGFTKKQSFTWHLKSCKFAQEIFKCPFCDDHLFSQKRDLVKHVSLAHPGTNWDNFDDPDDDDKKPAALEDSDINHGDIHYCSNDDDIGNIIEFGNANLNGIHSSFTSLNSTTHDKTQCASLVRKRKFVSYDQFYSEDYHNGYDSDESTILKSNCQGAAFSGVDSKCNIIVDPSMIQNEEGVPFNVEEFIVVDTVDEAVSEVIKDISCNLVNDHNGILDLQAEGMITKGFVNVFDQQRLCQVSLLKLLDGNNAPLHLFEDIMRWAHKSKIVNNYDFEIPAPQRKTLIRNLIEEGHYQSLLPKSIKLKLPHAQQYVKITTHNILASLSSLLTDTHLMKDENLIFKNNLFENPNDHSCKYIKDINDGSCYKFAYQIFCKDRSRDVMCPIILFIDKTHTDAKGNQTLEPVCMTLGIFNATTRNKENAWRIIGFIPSSSTITGRKLTPEQKRSDYHTMLSVVMAPLEQLQKYNGLAFEMAFRGSKFSVSLKIPILFVCGDSVGQDQLVGRQMKYHSLTENAHLCRYCDVPYKDSDNPFFEPTLTKASKIAHYIQKGDVSKLNEIGYYSIDKNALHGLSFCDTEYGLNGSLPADILHTYQLGILLYVVEAFFALKRPNQDTIRSKRLEQNNVDQKNKKKKGSKKRKITNNFPIARLDDDSLSLSVEERSSLNVFNDVEKDIFDRRAKQIGKALSQQSDRDLPRTHFPTGITGDKKKNGHEMQGVILNIIYVVLSDLSKYKRLMGDNEYEGRRLSNWVLLLERLLLIEEFLRTDTMKRKHVLIFSRYFPSFLEFLKRVVDRQSAAKFKLLKFHLCTHFASDIMKWGPPCCYNSSTGESNHKALKIRSRKTQRQVDLIEEQTAVRYVEHLAINHSLDIMISEEKIRKETINGHMSKSILKLNGLSYCQTMDGIYRVQNGLATENAKWNAHELQLALSSLLSKILPYIKGNNIPIYTSLNVGDNQIYRGDPTYKESVWQDWANCDWGEEGIIPVQILTFVD